MTSSQRLYAMIDELHKAVEPLRKAVYMNRVISAMDELNRGLCVFASAVDSATVASITFYRIFTNEWLGME